MRPFTTIAAVILGIISLGHLYRFAMEIPITIAGASLPQWPSLAGGIGLALLVFLVWREHAQPVARTS